MLKIVLQFQEREKLELTQIEFSHPLITDTPRIAIRGRLDGAYDDCVSFPWGKVSKAFALLMLRAKVFGAKDGKLTGEGKSAAAALDYAISKPPVWMQELFGFDAKGHFLLKRLLHRKNPERKRPGPVEIFCNEHHVRQEAICIRRGIQELQEKAEIESLLACLEQECAELPLAESKAGNLLVFPRQEREQKERSQLPSAISLSWEQAIFQAEIGNCLARSSIFSPSKLKGYLEQLKNNPSLSCLVKKPEEFLSPLLYASQSSERLGAAFPRHLHSLLESSYVSSRKEENVLRVWVSAVQPAGHAVFLHLRDTYKLPMHIDAHFSYGMQLYQTLCEAHEEEAPDICALGVGPAALLFQHKNKSYVPWMLGPELSHCILAKKGSSAQEIHRGEYHFVSDEPTTGSFCFDELERKQVLLNKGYLRKNCEPDEVMALFHPEDPDFRSLLWFPHYRYHEVLKNAQLFMPQDRSIAYQSTIFFVHKRLFAERQLTQALRAALFDVWLRLVEEPQSLQGIVRSMVENKDHMRYVRRCVGLQHMHEQSVWLQGVLGC